MFGGFALTALAETLWPRYAWTLRERAQHLARNLVLWALFLLVISLLVNWLLAPLSAAARMHGLGLLNLWPVPYWLAFIIGFLFADFSDYVLAPCQPPLPRTLAAACGAPLRPRLDVSTSLRQHPLFFVATLSIRALLTVALGAPVEAHACAMSAVRRPSHLHHAAIGWTAKASPAGSAGSVG